MTDVNISGIDKVQLLKALWLNAKPASFFGGSGTTPPIFNEARASSAVKDYIDYFDGRCIKTDLSKDAANPRLYDRDWGNGAFEKVVRSLKQ